ncbi:TadE/TadG family type IV pilus assembly protein [Novosphingobium sp.]|uniref:TadE/TadG family type IV pilus assembly protein n=1 Tax=Novosphingobium sp. TaxID=1874826 RepID=UPI001EBB1130|nr:TadE/TadG family type IV pilus assembly protein [Novosphingobium sp.]MBK9010195.1 pilus assembly protein TadE [Novosphingobium sp.]
MKTTGSSLPSVRQRRAGRFSRLVASLIQSSSGVAAIEFAMILPLFTGLGMYGIEIAYMSSVNMRISQIALEIADNASRMEQTNNSTIAPTVTEADIDSVMIGATTEGENFDFATNGRVILSSLERDPVTGKQFIHWQRCAGELNVQSDYGNDSTRNGLNGGTITALGRGPTKVTAPPGIAVMFVEVFYDYEGIFGTLFVENQRFKQEAAYLVRDVRDLRAASLPGVTGVGGNSQCE